MLKICQGICKKELPETEFYFRKDTQKYRNECKNCFNNKPYNKLQSTKNQKINNTYKQRYGITIEEKQQMLKAQNYKCFLTNLPLNTLDEACIDHCHKTGKIRKLLHNEINFAMGKFKDNINWYNNAILYLQNTSLKSEIKYIIQNNKNKSVDKNWNKQQYQKHFELMNRYKISLNDYYDILKLQNYKCPISEINHKEESRKRLFVDHCHQTGEIRGLLFNTINSSLGNFNHDIILIEKIKNYIKNWCP